MTLSYSATPVSIATEVYTRQIPENYKRFSDLIGEGNWKNRASLIKQEIRGNRFLDEYLNQENMIAMQLEHIRGFFEKYGGMPLNELNNHEIYPAAGFMAQVISIIDRSPKSFSEKFVGRVRGAFRNPPDMRGLRLELSAATHFALRGCKVKWPELASTGSVDLYVEDLGKHGLEIECKAISQDKGRKVSKRESMDFYGLLAKHLMPVRKGLSVGLSAVLTVPTRLPTSFKDREELAKKFARQIFNGENKTLEDGTQIRIKEFDLLLLPSFESESIGPHEIRSVIDDVTNTRNRPSMLIGTDKGGALVLSIQSAVDDSLLKGVFDTLSESASRQFSRSRGGMFFVGFQGLQGEQLLSIAELEMKTGQPPTALRIEVSKFLESTSRDHIVGVGFVSESGVKHEIGNRLNSGGTAYFFPKKQSPHWSEAYSGLFNWVRQK